MMIILYLEHVKNYHQIKINHNKPLALLRMTAMRILTTVYSLPMDLMKTVVAHLGYKKEDHVVEIWTSNTNNNVTHHANVPTLMMIILYLEHVKNYPQIKTNHNKPLALPQLIAMELQATVYSLPMDHMKTVVVLLLSKKEDHVVET
jgi:hypothetical protein